MIISTSITRDINYEEFNNNYEQGRAHFQRFKGGSAEYIKDYIPVHLKKDKPDSALGQIGEECVGVCLVQIIASNLH
jgi:hypothetical protein